MTVAALSAQARHNGGAGCSTRKSVPVSPPSPTRPLPKPIASRRPSPRPRTALRDAVTDAVAEQYEAWPYPRWTRVTRRAPKQLAEVIRELDPVGPETIPREYGSSTPSGPRRYRAPEILIAGCGTGREIAFHRVRYPDAKITAIDISGESLRYAADRLARIGLSGAETVQHDLHDVTSLGRRFDFISCIGVLHHLPDPEKGWAALAGVLKPGGVMQIMLYSAAARLRVQALRAGFADLLQGPMNDDLLREARRRAMARNAKGMLSSKDFFTLAGVHDLLLHRHEDTFDVRRIGRALDTLELDLLAFRLPNRHRCARYRAAHPHDPLFRDRAAWEALEKAEPTLFSGMYEFWCRKPVVESVRS